MSTPTTTIQTRRSFLAMIGALAVAPFIAARAAALNVTQLETANQRVRTFGASFAVIDFCRNQLPEMSALDLRNALKRSGVDLIRLARNSPPLT